mmetsp:Transcript_34166/g.96266  ORF Transcript_34166/g.96266 Transcript_34166/m.96266 type:complete len:222 (-) Transcript_34166:5-670(-)
MLDPHEIVVPTAHIRYHEEAQEHVGQQKLQLLREGRQEAVKVVGVLVGLAPLQPLTSHPEGRQRARGRGEHARENHAALRVPTAVLCDARVLDHVLRGQLPQEIARYDGLRVHPPQRLHVPEQIVLRQLVGEGYRDRGTPLRREHNAPDLLHVRALGRADPVHVARNLRAGVGYANELLQDVLGKDILEPRVLHVVRRHGDMVDAQAQAHRRDGPHPPVRT